jgi:uncharacterized protein
MTTTPNAADPSMEEILASIRRILNEDEAPPSAEPGTPAAEDDVLVLDQSMLVEADVTEETPEPVKPDVVEQPVAVPATTNIPFVKMEAPTPTPQPVVIEPEVTMPDLVAPEAAAAAAFSVGSLVRTLAAGRATQVYSGGPTLEDIVRSELRPLMKEWLDTNLPPMVERLVRAEIEKVVGRAGA